MKNSSQHFVNIYYQGIVNRFRSVIFVNNLTILYRVLFIIIVCNEYTIHK